MWPFIETFTLTFWGLVAVWIIVEILFAVEYERGYRFTAFAVFLGVLALFTTFNPFMWAWENPGDVIVWALIYVAIGAAWSLVKWHMFVGDKAREYAKQRPELYATYQSQNVAAPGGEPRYASFSVWLAEHYYGRKYPPTAKDEAGRIQFWTAWWPFSMAATVIGDFLWRLFRKIYELMSGLYDRITKARFSRFGDDFK